MSFPASLTVVTVHGTFLDGAGLPRSGKVIFRTPGYTMSGADDTFVLPRILAAFLDASGHFSIALPATNDPDWTPVGWTYRVMLDFGDDGRTDFGSIVVPYNLGGALSLASLAPVPPANGQLYALYNDPRFSGGGGGGGAVSSVAGRTGDVVLVKGDVGLGSVDNTSDVGKPVSTLQAAADALVAANASTALSSGLAGKANTTHTHAESDVTSLVADLALKAPLASPTFTGTVNGVTAAMVGLGNVNNTSDTNKPVSTAQQTALDGKQPLDADLTTIAGLTATTGNVIQSVASAWASVAPSALKTSLALVKADVGLGNVLNSVQLVAASNLSDVATPATARSNLGLGGAAVLSVGTTTGTVAAGDDSRITGAVQKSTVTAKGDLLVATASGAVTNVAVGSNTQVLTADSTQASGVKWAPGGAGSYSLPDGLDPPANFRQPFPPGRISTNVVPTLSRIYFIPLPMGPNARTLIELAIEVRTAAGAGGLASCSLCSSTTGRLPNAEIANFSTVATDTTGVKAWTISQALAANTLYYTALSFTVSGPAIPVVDAFNPYVAISGALSGTTAFGAYLMTGTLPLGATTFTYLDVDVSFRVTARFS